MLRLLQRVLKKRLGKRFVNEEVVVYLPSRFCPYIHIIMKSTYLNIRFYHYILLSDYIQF